MPCRAMALTLKFIISHRTGTDQALIQVFGKVKVHYFSYIPLVLEGHCSMWHEQVHHRDLSFEDPSL